MTRMRYVDISDLRDFIADPSVEINSKEDVLRLLEELEDTTERGEVVLGPRSTH